MWLNAFGRMAGFDLVVLLRGEKSHGKRLGEGGEPEQHGIQNLLAG